MTMKEVAEIVACPLQTAYARLYAARRIVQAEASKMERSDAR
jgi:RNA polymerase sigma-70 factor (ECF subfamily)